MIKAEWQQGFHSLELYVSNCSDSGCQIVVLGFQVVLDVVKVIPFKTSKCRGATISTFKLQYVTIS